MRAIHFIAIITLLSIVSVFASDTEEEDIVEVKPLPKSAVKNPEKIFKGEKLTEEQAQVILEKIKEGEKRQKDAQKFMEDLDEE